jgi:hypothetical protein
VIRGRSPLFWVATERSKAALGNPWFDRRPFWGDSSYLRLRRWFLISGHRFSSDFTIPGATRVVHDQFYSCCKRRAASGATALDCAFRFVRIAGEIAHRRGPFRSGGPGARRALRRGYETSVFTDVLCLRGVTPRSSALELADHRPNTTVRTKLHGHNRTDTTVQTQRKLISFRPF